MDLAFRLCLNRPMAQEAPSFSPLYKQIKRLILQALEAAEWQPGQIIPCELELASRFGVSQGTVRKAIDELAAENLLVRRQGKGTFVASHRDPRAAFRFLRLKAQDGQTILRSREPLACGLVKAGEELVNALGLETGDPVVSLRRRLRFDDKPVVVEDVYLPGDIFSGLDLEMLKAWEGSLYGLFETRFGVRMIRAEEKIRAVAADETAAGLLEVAAGTPLLLVERVAFSYGGKPVEWRRGLYSTAEHYYANELN